MGERVEAPRTERVVQIECEIDDMNPQLFGPLMDRLAEAGALDVFYAAVQMKKNRPGTLVTVIAPPEQARSRRRRPVHEYDDHRRALPGDAARHAWIARSGPSTRRSGRCGSRLRAATAAC